MIGATRFSRARHEQQRNCPRVGQNTSSDETGRMVSGASEDNCDVLNDEGYSTYNYVYFLFAELSLVVLYLFY